MANQHTAALEARAAELADQFVSLTTRRNDLIMIAKYPECGKPGHGFKAARKASKEIAPIEAELRTIQQEMRDFVRGSSKDSDKKRERRYSYVKAALAELGA